MSRRAELIDAVMENPGDDAACFAFADWLHEHAQSLPEGERVPVAARAEFIRLQIQLGALPAGLHSLELLGRAEYLVGTYMRSWAQPIGYLCNDYQRGFLHLPLSDEQFAEIVPPALKLEPIFADVMARKWSRREPATEQFLERFKSAPHLRAVTGLCMVDLKLGPSGLAQVFSSPFLKHVTSVAIIGDDIGVEGIRAIAESPAPFRLAELMLERAIKRTHARVVEYIAQSPRFAHLHELALPANGLKNRSLEALLASKTLPTNLALNMHGNPCDCAAFAQQLAERFGRAA